MSQSVWMVVAAFVIAGCGSADDNPPAGAASPAPAAEADASATQPQRVAGLPTGWELAPRTKVAGRQAAGVVTLTATGENPTGGYENKLFQSPLRTWPPQFILARKKPDGMATQAFTPYEVTALFKADRKLATVVVHDAGGRSPVNIAQAQD